MHRKCLKVNYRQHSEWQAADCGVGVGVGVGVGGGSWMGQGRTNGAVCGRVWILIYGRQTFATTKANNTQSEIDDTLSYLKY